MASLSTSVCSPTVRIIAFQAIDPGSTPGRRRGIVLPNFIMSLCNSTSANVQCTILKPFSYNHRKPIVNCANFSISQYLEK